MHDPPQMALIERFTIPEPIISIRSTTSSLSDYPEWCVEDLSDTSQESVVTDGSCS